MTWVNMLNVETFPDHPAGAVEFTPEVLRTIADNFKPHTIPVAYPSEGNLGPYRTLRDDMLPAYGFLVEMEIRADGRELWGRVEPQLPPGAIDKYGSVTVDMESVDRMTGERIGAQLLAVDILPKHRVLSETLKAIR